MINDILANKKIGQLFNLLTLHSQRLGIRKDSGDLYSMAKDILNKPKNYKSILDKLKQYEK